MILVISAIFEEVGAGLGEENGAVGDVVVGVGLKSVGEALRGFEDVSGKSDGALCGVCVGGEEMEEEREEEKREGGKEGGRHGVCGNVCVWRVFNSEN